MFEAEFFIATLVVVLVPGTGVIYTVSTGIFSGWRASISAACGCTIGIVPHLAACIAGLSALLFTSAVAFRVLQYAGVGYLFYFAWSMWRETDSLSFQKGAEREGFWQISRRGFLINILNPKLSVFFLAYLPQFVSTAATTPPLLQLVFLGGIFMGTTFLVFVLYGLLAHGVGAFLLSSPRSLLWIRRSFAAIFALLGVRLAMSGQ